MTDDDTKQLVHHALSLALERDDERFNQWTRLPRDLIMYTLTFLNERELVRMLCADRTLHQHLVIAGRLGEEEEEPWKSKSDSSDEDRSQLLECLNDHTRNLAEESRRSRRAAETGISPSSIEGAMEADHHDHLLAPGQVNSISSIASSTALSSLDHSFSSTSSRGTKTPPFVRNAMTVSDDRSGRLSEVDFPPNDETQAFLFWTRRFDKLYAPIWSLNSERPDFSKGISLDEARQEYWRKHQRQSPPGYFAFFWQTVCCMCFLRTCPGCGQKIYREPQRAKSGGRQRPSLVCDNCQSELQLKTYEKWKKWTRLMGRTSLLPLLLNNDKIPLPFCRIASLFNFFDSNCDGLSYLRLRSKYLSGVAPSILVVRELLEEARPGQPFGFLLSSSLPLVHQPQTKFYSAVFTFNEDSDGEDSEAQEHASPPSLPAVWTTKGDILSTERIGQWLREDRRTGLAVGGRPGSAAISLDATLSNGSSWPSVQFQSTRRLSRSSRFQIHSVELWAPYWALQSSRRPRILGNLLRRRTTSLNIYDDDSQVSSLNQELEDEANARNRNVAEKVFVPLITPFNPRMDY